MNDHDIQMKHGATPPHHVTFSGSTVFVLIATASWIFTVAQGQFFPKFVDMPMRLATVIVFLIWPASSVVAAVWSAANLVRQRRVQWALELLVAMCSLLLVYYIIIDAPVMA